MDTCDSPVIILLFCIFYFSTVSAEDPVCGTPTQLSHGSIRPTKSAYNSGEIVTYSCDSAYKLQPSKQNRTCLEDGTWSGLQPQCIQNQTLKPILRNRVENSTNQDNQTCRWTYKLKRFYLVDTITFNFTYRPTNMVVVINDFEGDISTQRHVLLDGNDLKPGGNNSIKWTGKSIGNGYELVTNASLVYINGISVETNRSEGNCSISKFDVSFQANDVFETCSPPPIPLHSVVEYNSTLANYSCLHGYELFNKAVNEFQLVECIDGIWETPTPLCRPDGSLVAFWILFASSGGSLITGFVLASIVVFAFFLNKQKTLNKVKLRVPSYIRQRRTMIDDEPGSETPALEMSATRPPAPPPQFEKPKLRQVDFIKDLQRNLRRFQTERCSTQVEVHETSADRYVIDYARHTTGTEISEDDYLTMNDGRDENIYEEGEPVYGNSEEATYNTTYVGEPIYNNDEPIYSNL